MSQNQATTEKAGDKWLKIFRETDEKRNFAVVVENKMLYVSKSELAVFSPVFEIILFSPDFVESSKMQLTLPEKSYESINEFCACLFLTDQSPYTRKPVDYKNFALLTNLADEYDCRLIYLIGILIKCV